MSERYSGATFEVVVEEGRVTATFVHRPDLSYAEGAEAAGQLAELLERLAAREDVVGAALDLLQIRSAPGPKTRAFLSTLFSSWERARRRIAVIVPRDQAMVMVQMSRITTDSAPEQGCVVTTASDARRWLDGDEPESALPSFLKL